MRAQSIAGGSAVVIDHDEEERRLRDVARQIVEAHPWASQDRVATILRANYDAFAGAKVQDYRLVLAERDTLDRLRNEGPPSPSTATSAVATG